jgi:trk system potassium uptake protein TrkH
MRNRYQTFHVVLNVLGSLYIFLGFFLLIPLVVVFLSGEIQLGLRTALGFLLPSLFAFALGVLCRVLFRPGRPSGIQAMLICSLGWLGFSAIGAFPFVIGIGASFLNGFFEAMSGFTTTGITMFTGLDEMPRSILFWRSLTQWVGGLGILTFFLAVTSRGATGYSLFGAESHKIETGRPVPGLANTLKILWSIYAGFTALIFLALVLAKMSFFDSLCHSFTALSTGGFSPHDGSIEYYRLSGYVHFVWIEYILIVGMLMGGTNFLIHYRVLNGNGKALFDNTEMKYWWSLILLFVILIFGERFVKLGSMAGVPFGHPHFWGRIEQNFRIVLFQVSSIITTTGFGTRDIGAPFFGQMARQLFLVMMVIGGCVGSTGGGLKVLRVSILIKLIKRELFRLRSPLRSISSVVIDGKPVTTNEIYRISGLFFTWVSLLLVGGGVTAFLSRHGAFESFSGMFSALGNIGPCYISVGKMGQLHAVIKVVYIFGMLAGRLEILPVLLLFSRKAWKS